MQFFQKLSDLELRSRGAPDPAPDPAGYPVNFVDPVRIRPDPETVDPVEIRIRPEAGSRMSGSGSGRIQNLRIRIQPDPT